MADLIKCPKCQSEVGAIVNIEGQPLLQAGGVLCRELHGVCAQCGYGLHWSLSNQMLASLIERVLQLQKK